ncbi:MAG: hypothetical protein AB9903_18060 [Vulcanimicrobiota bacterium]
MWRRRFISRRTYKDSRASENLQGGSSLSSDEETELFEVKEGAQLVPEDLHEMVRSFNRHTFDNEEDLVTFDYHLCRLSQTRALLDLCLGELLCAFRKGYGELGYSKIDDFAVEHLSFSGRLASELMHNHEKLLALPLTKEAYIKGAIVKSALRLLLRVATNENEAELLDEIQGLSVREIESLVKARSINVKVCETELEAGAEAGVKAETNGGAETKAKTMTEIQEEAGAEAGAGTEAGAEAGADTPSEEADYDERDGVMMKFNVPRTLALTWDFALEHFRERERTKGPVYGFVEALVAGFLASTADLASSAGQAYASLMGHVSPEGIAPVEKTAPAEDFTSAACLESTAGPASVAAPAFAVAPESAAAPESTAIPASTAGPASAGENILPLLFQVPFWIDFPSEQETQAGKKDASFQDITPDDEYPDPKKEERWKYIRESLSLKPFAVKLPESYSQIPDDPDTLSRRIIRVASMRQSIDYHIGWFLKALRDRHLYRRMEFSKIEDYAKARLNISASTTSRLIRLAAYFSTHPDIEEAFLRRKITREQAFLILSLEDREHEEIWLDFAMKRPTRELRNEVSRILRIKEYDHFASHNYALLPGFRYITDDTYWELPEEVQDVLRTGEWYRGRGSVWPLAGDNEYLLDRDFKMRVDSEIGMDFMSKCAGEVEPGQVDSQSKCAGEVENDCQASRLTHSSEVLEETRALCTLPDSARPAMTFLLDILGSRSSNDASDTHGCIPPNPGVSQEPTMSIHFFLPRELYGVWNEAVRRYLIIISPEDGIELLAEGEGADRFIAYLLGDYLSTERAHHKASHNSEILERDGYQCQVPGCSNRRNLHAHHIEFRSQGGCDEPWNELCLCATHHLWILHYLHRLKIEGTAPHNLTFTFGANAGPDGKPFIIYRNGRKVLAPLPEEEKSESFYNAGQGSNPHNISEAGLSHNAETWPADVAGSATEGPGRSYRPEQLESTDKTREQEAA